MPPRLLILLVSFLMAAGVQAAPEAVAIVDVDKLFSEYHVSKAKRGSIESLRERLAEDPRLELITGLKEELTALKNRIRDPQTLVSEKEELFQTFQMKAHELNSLQRDVRQHLLSEQAKIDAELVKLTRELLARIREEIALHAEVEGFELVLETSGTTSSQVPTLLYSRNAIDITEAVLARLNRDQPEAREGGEDEAVSSHP